MYLDRLHVRHLKLLRDFRLGFTGADGEPRMWTVIIGRNGTAKTSIVQAIALAAAGSRQVSVLAKPVIGHLVDRRSKAPLSIDAVFRFSPQSADKRLHPMPGRDLAADERLESQLSLRRRQTTFDGSSSYVQANAEDTPVEAVRRRKTGQSTSLGFLDHLSKAKAQRFTEALLRDLIKPTSPFTAATWSMLDVLRTSTDALRHAKLPAPPRP